MYIIGHRGACGLAPENTIASIKAAIECGADEIEVDVRITRDNVPVLSHDKSLAGANDMIEISTHTLQELRAAVTAVSTLAEAYAYIAGRVTLQIEVKPGEPVAPVTDTIRGLKPTAADNIRIVLSSKSQKTLRQLHDELPDIPTVVIESWSAVRAVYRARQLDTLRISMRSWWLWRGVLRQLHQRGYLVTPYTMNNPGAVQKWAPYLHGVVTDYPDRFPAQNQPDSA